MKKAGYTLVEMLVVIGIVVLLAALLFPIFVRVREYGRRNTCRSNLHQIGLDIQQYVQDYNGRYFPAAALDQYSVSQSFVGFEPHLSFYKKMKQGDGTEAPDIDVPDWMMPELTCPDFTFTFQDASFGHEDHRAFPSYFFNFLSKPSPPFRTPSSALEIQKLLPQPLVDSQLTKTSDTWMIREQQGHNEDFMPRVTSSCGRTERWNTRHSGGSNYLYFDGHVQWFTPTQAAETDCSGEIVTQVHNS